MPCHSVSRELRNELIRVQEAEMTDLAKVCPDYLPSSLGLTMAMVVHA